MDDMSMNQAQCSDLPMRLIAEAQSLHQQTSQLSPDQPNSDQLRSGGCVLTLSSDGPCGSTVKQQSAL